MGKEFGYSVRERNGTPGDVNAWNNMITSIPLLHERFQNVCVRNFCAMKLLREIEFQDGDVVYLDPPYVKDTRVTPDAYGEEEMSEEQHLALLTLVAPFEVPTMISGYSHPMYNSMLSKWNRYEIKTVAHSGQSLTKTPRTEIVWTNYRRF
jgi:DNA adenine methylase